MIGTQGTIAVLDGQQRLTALNIGLKGWYASKLPYHSWANDLAFPKRRLYLNLLAPAEDVEFAYEFRLLRDEEVEGTSPDKHWFLVRDVLKFKNVAEVFAYCVANGLAQPGQMFAHQTLIELWYVIKERPLVNYYLEDAQDLDKVLNIFIRVNSGGTPLSYSDMLLSIATAQWRETDAREEIHGLVDELNQVGEGFDFNKDFVLKACLVLSDIGAIEFKVDNFNLDNMLTIEQQWDSITRALRLAVRLAASWGYNRQTLTSNNALIPLAYSLYKHHSPANFVEASIWKSDREKMRRWLMTALLKRTFSGQADTVLRPIRQVLNETVNGFPEEAILQRLDLTPKSMRVGPADLEGFLAYRYNQRYTFSVLALLYPWLKYDQHFHVDHIFPRSKFTRKELDKLGVPRSEQSNWLDHVDDLANLQLLQGTPNIEKSDQPFEAWLAKIALTPAERANYRELHLIPNVDLSFENFPAFRDAREKLMREQLERLLVRTSTKDG